jgi:hypothetical protein
MVFGKKKQKKSLRNVHEIAVKAQPAEKSGTLTKCEIFTGKNTQRLK